MAVDSTKLKNSPLDKILVALAGAGGIAELESFVALKKGGDGLATFALTERGEELDAEYRRIFRLAEEKGQRDREVVQRMGSMSEAWPSHPGVIENAVNDLVEAGQFGEALEAARIEVSKWGALLKKGGINHIAKLHSGSSQTHLFVQVLANYEFALERAGDLSEALAIARLTIAIEPSDPQSLVSSVISLCVRTGHPEEALAELDHMPDSIAPFVLYGRALAFYALQQFENAATAIQTALRYWPAVAQGIGREWKTGTPMPKPGEAVSENQVLYGYSEVFGPAWNSVDGAMEWLRTEEKKFVQSGARQQQYVGLTKSGLKTDAHGNILGPTSASDDRLASAKVVGEDTFFKLLEVGPNEYVYALTDEGEKQEEKLNGIFKQDLKYHDRLNKLAALCDEWPGHANAAVALARFYVSDRKFDRAVDLLERPIFALQSFWPDNLVGKGKIEIDWAGNKPILTAYAHMVLDSAEAGEVETARNFANDYLAFNPKDNLGVRQKAIELALLQSDIAGALKIIDEARDSNAAHNLFGRPLALFAAARKEEATEALHTAVKSRPKIYNELTGDKHRMPPNYNPTFVAYYSNEEAYNYWVLWSSLWRNTLGALNWLRKEGKIALHEKSHSEAVEA